MADDPKDWLRVYEALRQELDPAKQLEICQNARKAIQDRLLALGSGRRHRGEREALEQALRAIWVLEEEIRNRKPRIQ
jgi:hypothetical protein